MSCVAIKNTKNTLKFFCFLALVSVTAQAEVLFPTKSKDHINVSLIAERINPSTGNMRFGVLFKLDPGWHIYWRNPGDTGIAPKIQWRSEALLEQGELQWPFPELIPISHLVNIAYHQETLLWSELKFKIPSKDEPLPFFAELEWLVCEEACVPGGASFEVDLNALSQEANIEASKLFDDWQTRLPIPLNVLEAQAILDADSISIELYAHRPIFKGVQKVDVLIEELDVVAYGQALEQHAENNVLFWKQKTSTYFREVPKTLTVHLVLDDERAHRVHIPVKKLSER